MNESNTAGAVIPLRWLRALDMPELLLTRSSFPAVSTFRIRRDLRGPRGGGLREGSRSLLPAREFFHGGRHLLRVAWKFPLLPLWLLLARIPHPAVSTFVFLTWRSL